MIEIHGESGKIGEVTLKGGKVAGSTPAVQHVADHMLRKHGSPQKAFQAMGTLNNGYVWAQAPAEGKRSPAWEHAGITEQALDLAAGVTVAPEAMESPGLPVPDDPDAVSMFTAHRIDEILHKLSHASQRMEAARSASGDLRKYHAARLAGHLKAALDAGHDLAANVRAHYPDEGAELEQVKQSVGLAKAVSDDARAATTAHLLETTLHELTHASRHAQAMLVETPDDEQVFNGEHCAKHLVGATEHVGKLAAHFKDNYPQVARWLNQLDQIRSSAEGSTGPQHARYGKDAGETISAQFAIPSTISGHALLA